MTGSVLWSRRRLIATGAQVVCLGELAMRSGMAVALSVDTPPRVGFVLERGIPQAENWWRDRRPGVGGRVLVHHLGEGDLYAWWRDFRRGTTNSGAVSQVHGFTRWAAWDVMRWCAREAGLPMNTSPVSGIGAGPASVVAWRIG